QAAGAILDPALGLRMAVPSGDRAQALVAALPQGGARVPVEPRASKARSQALRVARSPWSLLECRPPIEFNPVEFNPASLISASCCSASRWRRRRAPRPGT